MNAPIKVLFFAHLAEQLQCREKTVEWQDSWRCEYDLRCHLLSLSPHWQPLQTPDIRCAVNHTMAHRQTLLQPGDEVAYFPPVTGG